MNNVNKNKKNNKNNENNEKVLFSYSNNDEYIDISVPDCKGL